MLGEMDIDMDNIAVLSIGTGSAIKDLRKGTLKSKGRGWGMLEWILPNEGNIVTTIMDGSSEASQAIVEVFFKVSPCSAHTAADNAKHVAQICCCTLLYASHSHGMLCQVLQCKPAL